jgi:hypothetical protein
MSKAPMSDKLWVLVTGLAGMFLFATTMAPMLRVFR